VLGKKIPVIADSYVERGFGTGALKITPAHDPNDFEVGERHQLPIVKCINEYGKMNEEACAYKGQTREECRKAIVNDLKIADLLEKEEDYLHSVGHCSRCNTVIEPYLSPQWFLKMKDLAAPAIKAVENHEVRFIPERFSKIYLNWMENIRDWCISRQLWWGHRIPVWHCQKCEYENAYLEEPAGCPKCHEPMLQENDVLDTWFSSGLWPFATLGWPKQTEDLKYFYPTSVLVTGRDIIFLWVSRMIMMGLEFMGKVPFTEVCIHPTILAKSGKRMSKSLGTGVDPLELFETFGTDATRFGLILQTEQGQDIKFSEERIEMSRNFCNKIWNATRFALNFLESAPSKPDESALNLTDRWILSRLQNLIQESLQGLKTFEFHHLARAAYNFFWDEFCDWYLEIIKPDLYGEDLKLKAKTVWILTQVFDVFLPLIHPLMPFISAEIWENLPGERKPLLLTPYPAVEASRIDLQAEEDMKLFMEFVRALRNLRTELGLAPKEEVTVLLETGWQEWLNRPESKFAKNLAKVSEITLSNPETWNKNTLQAMVAGKLIGIEQTALQVEKIMQLLDKELAKITQEKAKLENELQSQIFKEKAPELYELKLKKAEELKAKTLKIQQEIEKYK
jgi:valyl-tRNA synthetase